MGCRVQGSGSVWGYLGGSVQELGSVEKAQVPTNLCPNPNPKSRKPRVYSFVAFEFHLAGSRGNSRICSNARCWENRLWPRTRFGSGTPLFRAEGALGISISHGLLHPLSRLFIPGRGSSSQRARCSASSLIALRCLGALWCRLDFGFKGLGCRVEGLGMKG